MDRSTETARDVTDMLLRAGADLGISAWLTVDEAMNQVFADVTRDPQPMRIDGRPYAHGFLTMSLIPSLMASAMQLETIGDAMQQGYLLNYGFNRLRLIEPIPLGARVRGHFKTCECGPTPRDTVTVIPIDVYVEIENSERPAMVGEWLAAWRK